MPKQSSLMMTCPLPWQDEGVLDESVFRDVIRTACHHADAVYVFGTAGEGNAVGSALYQDIVNIFHQETSAANASAQVGVIDLSTSRVLEKIDIARAVGFRDFQISFPSWGRMSRFEAYRFLTDICTAHPDARFLHYNTSRSGFVLGTSDYVKLATELPNLVATKNSVVDRATAAELVTSTPRLTHFFTEDAYAGGIREGNCSLISAHAWLEPSKALGLVAAGRAEDYSVVDQLSAWAAALSEAVLGHLREPPRADGAYDKALMKLGELPSMHLRLLSPYQGLSDEEFRVCADRLSSFRPEV